jgi:hypothetical protein
MKFTFSYYRKRGLPFVSFIKTLGRPRQRWEDNIKMDLKVKDRRVWAGFIWIRIGKSGGLP